MPQYTPYTTQATYQKRSSLPCSPQATHIDLEIFKPYAGKQTKMGGVMSTNELQMSAIVMIDAANCIDIHNRSVASYGDVDVGAR
jgi:hypothetical protein